MAFNIYVFISLLCRIRWDIQQSGHSRVTTASRKASRKYFRCLLDHISAVDKLIHTSESSLNVKTYSNLLLSLMLATEGLVYIFGNTALHNAIKQ